AAGELQDHLVAVHILPRQQGQHQQVRVVQGLLLHRDPSCFSVVSFRVFASFSSRARTRASSSSVCRVWLSNPRIRTVSARAPNTSSAQKFPRIRLPPKSRIPHSSTSTGRNVPKNRFMSFLPTYLEVRCISV